MGTYLEDFLESVASLPAELNRNFALMRELDARSQELVERIERNSKLYLSRLRKRRGAQHPDDDPLLTQMQTDQKTSLEFADEKVQLAVQTYELIDNHIRRLDGDLRKFESELKQGTFDQAFVETNDKRTTSTALHTSGGSGSSSHHKRKADHLDKGASRGQLTTNKSSSRPKPSVPAMTKGQREGADEHRVLNIDLDLPIDPHEPVYCVCQRVSFGEMIACENPDCPFEWFHFECVGITGGIPKGRWLCPTCSAKQKKKQVPTTK